uniref:Uncharacterized protein n=1 Tax=Caenorhabditis japonica TaxID=281687 RepID=A0A8R1IKE4_CAEJA
MYKDIKEFCHLEALRWVVPTGQRFEALFPLRQGLVRTASNERYDLKFEQLKEEWTKIRLQTLTNLIESMQRRCETVIKAKGLASKY